jgi:hypothetical protein
VSESNIDPEERRRIRDAMARAVRAIQAREGRSSAMHIAHSTGLPVDTVRSYLQARRRPRPEFVRALAQRAGLPAADLFAAIGWLPPHEVVPWDPVRVAEQVVGVSTTIERLVPHIRRALATLDTTAPAPVIAAQALLADDDGARRYSVLLSKVVSAGRYATATNTVAEFRLRPDEKPLTVAEADRLAERAGLPWRPDKDLRSEHPDYWNASLELRARTHVALSGLDVGQYTWQGEPGTSTWADAAQSYPAHLLVQDPFGGAGWPAAATQWPARPADTLVVIGGRYDSSTAAAVLAEALGWQFVPVRFDVEVTADGYVFPVRRDGSFGRPLAWASVARHIESRYRAGDPWRAVVLVRSSAFLGAGDVVDDHALALLRRTSARIVYARPPVAFLRWWAARQQGTAANGRFDTRNWLTIRREVLDRIERELAARPASRDLSLLIPQPRDLPLTPRSAVPPEVVDAQALVAWSALRWLDELWGTRNDSALDGIRPGTLARWLPQLRAANEPALRRLMLEGPGPP